MRLQVYCSNSECLLCHCCFWGSYLFLGTQSQLAFAHTNVSALSLAAQLPPLSLPSSSSSVLSGAAAATSTSSSALSAASAPAAATPSALRTHIPASEYLSRGTAIAHQLLRLRAGAAVVRLDGSHAPLPSQSQSSAEKSASEKSSVVEVSSSAGSALLPAGVRAQVEHSHGAVRRLELEARQLLRAASVSVSASAVNSGSVSALASVHALHANRVVPSYQPPAALDHQCRLMGRLSLPAQFHTDHTVVFGDEVTAADTSALRGCGDVSSRAVAMRPAEFARLHSAVAF